MASEVPEMVKSLPVISFCSTCMNRGEQLRGTLENNLKVVAEYRQNVELCLVNFIRDEESEAIDEWVRGLDAPANFQYFVSRELGAWHASIAKNTSHRVANALYVINLDCDNFLDPRVIDRLLGDSKKKLNGRIFWGFTGGHQLLLRHGQSGPLRRILTLGNKKLRPRYISIKNMHCRNGCDMNGTYGNIGMSKQLFMSMGGYDESLPPSGGQDANVLMRALNFDRKVKLLRIRQEILPLPNTKLDALRNTDTPNTDWAAMRSRTTRMTFAALRRGELVANGGRDIGVPCERIMKMGERPSVRAPQALEEHGV